MSVRHPTPAAQNLPSWPFQPLTPHQVQRHQLQAQALRLGRLARWPAGLTHLPQVEQ